MSKHLTHSFATYGLTREQLLLAAATGIMLAGMGLMSPEVRSLLMRCIPRLRRRSSGPGISIGKDWISDTARLRHTHIVGATGTGKTVLIEKLLFEDLKRGYGAIIIDPKGERGFYESVKDYCKQIGREADLHLLSATFPEESAVWNPCSLGNASELQTKFFNSAIYSEPHYAKACEFGLLQAFRELCQEKEQFNIRDLLKELETISEDDKNETLKGLFFDLNNLVYGEWEDVLACGKRPASKQEISLLEIVKGNKILFVDLPTEGKKVQSSRIGRLLTQEIILISGMRKRNAALKGDRPFSVYIDEFDAFATESFSTFLNKGRSSEFMIHLAHQTLSDLNCVSPEFTGQILGNCNVRFIFRQDDPDDAERWSRFIGTHMVVKQTFRAKDGMRTGDSSNREAQEFIIAPDTIKSLRVGECVLSQKTEDIAKTIRVPFEKKVSPSPVTQSKSSDRATPQQVENVIETPSSRESASTVRGADEWQDFLETPSESNSL